MGNTEIKEKTEEEEDVKEVEETSVKGEEPFKEE